ncbi:hypothetical protein Noda2021_08640 [Candidatus Dependentiae bacterium Noda2021]|nr:hypothetical protein Noda2021_08640 [Candidatus Dependentiae bacterium Noda2021]
MRRPLFYLLLLVVATPSYSFFNSPHLWNKVCPVLLKELKKKIKKNQVLHPHTKQVLQSSIKRFKYTPGFVSTIQTLLAHTSVFEGTLFEVVCGRDVHKQTPIIGFNQIKTSDNQKAQFDLIVTDGTQEKWIECKKIDWHKAWRNRKRRKALQEQFIRQQNVARFNHQLNGLTISYYVYSATSITDEWGDWFATKNIQYCEHFFEDQKKGRF